jgi:hypothetical protein
LREFQNDILSVNWLELVENSSYNAIERRQYPIFHYVKESFEKDGLAFSDLRLNSYFNLRKIDLVAQLIEKNTK